MRLNIIKFEICEHLNFVHALMNVCHEVGADSYIVGLIDCENVKRQILSIRFDVSLI